MSSLSNLNGVFKARPVTNPKAQIPERTIKKSVKIANNDPVQEQSAQTTRRLALGGLASLALLKNAFNSVALAEDNGFWVTSSRIPNPTVDNKIMNEKTGTRSFIKKGLFMADIGVATRMYRIRKCAFDLLAMEDLIDKDKLNYVHKYLRMKSTFMYFDFDRVITAAKDEEKQPLLDLANKFFDNAEELESATRQWNIDRTETVYKDTKVMLEEIMERMGEMYSNA